MSSKNGRAGIIFSALITFCFLLVSFGSAETKYDLDGKKAFQFGITNNFNLKDFQGGTVSFKKHYSNSKAWRLGLDLDFGFHTDEGFSSTNDTVRSIRDNSDNSQNINLRIQRLFYQNRTSRVKPFLGIGPMFGFRHSIGTITDESPIYENIRESTSTTYSWSLGITGLAGIEWFASPNISLLAEYSTDLAYKYRKHKLETKYIRPDNGRTSTGETTYKDLNFDPVYVRFGLSVYF